MFRCDRCKKITEPREKLTKMPILKRDRVYEIEILNGKKKETKVSFGEEIVKEINLCEKCALEVLKNE